MTTDDLQKEVALAFFRGNFSLMLEEGINLLFKFDPTDDPEKLVLQGNDVLERAYITAREAIAIGDLPTLEESTRKDGRKTFRIKRDTFVEWARKNFPQDGEELHDLLTRHKKQSVHRAPSRQESHRAAYQKIYDDMCIEEFRRTGNVPKKKDLCARIEPFDGHKKDTINRYAKGRNRDWIEEEIQRRADSLKN